MSTDEPAPEDLAEALESEGADTDTEPDMGDTDTDTGAGIQLPGGDIATRFFDSGREGPAPADLQNQYGIESRGIAVMMRGLMRIAVGDGTPPIVDMTVGAVMWYSEQADTQESTDVETPEGVP